jgi:hypothetical protein
LLRLPSGQPLLRGTNNIAARLFSFFLLPTGRPRLRPPNPPDPPALGPPRAPTEDIVGAGAS